MKTDINESGDLIIIILGGVLVFQYVHAPKVVIKELTYLLDK
jgi:hypothetical protein